MSTVNDGFGFWGGVEGSAIRGVVFFVRYLSNSTMQGEDVRDSRELSAKMQTYSVSETTLGAAKM
jgi:hypothetical protein